MKKKNGENISKKEIDIDIDFEKLEELIYISTQEVIEQHEYMKILEDKDDTKKEEINKTYKLR